MPGSATDYLRQRVLGHTLGFAAYAMPSPAFMALCVSTPTAATPGVPVVGGAYVRLQGAWALTDTTNIAANTATLEWPPATAPWGKIGWFELWDAVTAGNRLYWGPLVDPLDGITEIARDVLTGDIVRFSAGVIQVRAT